MGGEIINADASQLYRDLAIVSARPTAAEEAAVPHRLYGVLAGADVCSVARWVELAKAEIAAARASGRQPIIVGGTGMYLTALVHGLAPVPAIDEQVRAAVRALDTASAHTALEREDPGAAARLMPARGLRAGGRRRALRPWWRVSLSAAMNKASSPCIGWQDCWGWGPVC